MGPHPPSQIRQISTQFIAVRRFVHPLATRPPTSLQSPVTTLIYLASIFTGECFALVRSGVNHHVFGSHLRRLGPPGPVLSK